MSEQINIRYWTSKEKLEGITRIKHNTVYKYNKTALAILLLKLIDEYGLNVRVTKVKTGVLIMIDTGTFK